MKIELTVEEYYQYLRLMSDNVLKAMDRAKIDTKKQLEKENIYNVSNLLPTDNEVEDNVKKYIKNVESVCLSDMVEYDYRQGIAWIIDFILNE